MHLLAYHVDSNGKEHEMKNCPLCNHYPVIRVEERRAKSGKPMKESRRISIQCSNLICAIKTESKIWYTNGHESKPAYDRIVLDRIIAWNRRTLPGEMETTVQLNY